MDFDFEQSRDWMINHQVRPWNVFTPAVLNALGKIKREDFVPEAYRNLAFADTEIPLPAGQRMLKPVLEGRLLQALQADAAESVLVVGTGSGFFTGLVAASADSVVTIELHEELTNYAGTKLALAKLGNVELVTADYTTWTPGRCFDRIILTGSLPAFDERLPEWLNDGGFAIAAIGSAPSMEIERISRTGEHYTRETLFENVLPELEHVGEPPAFRF